MIYTHIYIHTCLEAAKVPIKIDVWFLSNRTVKALHASTAPVPKSEKNQPARSPVLNPQQPLQTAEDSDPGSDGDDKVSKP